MPEWAWMLVIGSILLGLVAYVWRTHEDHDLERNKNLWDQIGRDSKSGMRKDVHDAVNTRVRVIDLERRVKRIERHLNGALRAEDD